MQNVLGHHLLVEFYNCNAQVLDDVEGIERHMREAAVACGATIVTSSFHRFQPWGVSGVVVISESHLAIHTWPEYGYASVDLYTCGDTVEPMVAYEHLHRVLEADEAEIQTLKRGNLDLIKARLEKQMAGTVIPAAPEPVLVKGGAA